MTHSSSPSGASGPSPARQPGRPGAADPKVARDLASAGRGLEAFGRGADHFVRSTLAQGEKLAGEHEAARFASGVAHALTTVVTGTLELAGASLQLAEEKTRQAAGQAIQAIVDNPVAVAQQVWSEFQGAFQRDPARMSGEVVGSLLPIGATLKAAGKIGRLGRVGQAARKADQVADGLRGIEAASRAADAGQAARMASPSQGVAAAARSARGAEDAARLARVPAPGPRILTQEALDTLNRGVQPLTDLGAMTARDKAFAALYRDPDLQRATSEAVTQWVMGGKDQLPLREAFAALKQGGDHPLRDTLQKLMDTREARWDRLAARHGIERPSHFRLYRGVQSENAMEELVRAWETPGKKGLQLQHHSVNSWSTNPSVARDMFASGGEVAVVYDADVPFRRTIADKWVDGSGFLQWTPDQDEVMVATHGLTVPANRVQAVYQGQRYGYEQREALIAAWRATHPRQP